MKTTKFPYVCKDCLICSECESQALAKSFGISQICKRSADSQVFKREFKKAKDFFRAAYQGKNAVHVSLTYSPKNTNPYIIESDVLDFVSGLEERVGEEVFWLCLIEPHKKVKGAEEVWWHVHVIVFFQKDTGVPFECKQCVEDSWVHGEVYYKEVFSKGIIDYLTKNKRRFHLYPVDLKFVCTSSDNNKQLVLE
jgi:hypothetical protein